MGERANVASGSTPPAGFVVTAQTTTKTDGVFVDAFIGAFGGHDSESPLGTATCHWALGTGHLSLVLEAMPSDKCPVPSDE